ncbi:MAG: hypothetical protein AAFP76_16220 [Bacteroidota bacterium]
MAQNNQEEIDLLFFFKQFNKLVKRGVVSLFKALGFARKYWIVILVLALAGAGYGYYVQSNAKPSQKARLLVRINFDAVNDVYSVVTNVNNEIAGGILAKTGDAEVDKELARVGSLELTPIINIKEILAEYDSNDRRLEGIVKNLDFEFEEEGEFAALSETFRSEYKFHYLDVSLSSSASPNTIHVLLKHINGLEFLQAIKTNGANSLEARIASTKETIEQINHVVETYKVSENNPAANAQLFVVDKNFNISEIFKNKMALQKQLEGLERDKVYSSDVLVNVNKPSLFTEEGFFSNKMLIYPILFVFAFFGLALLRTAYMSMKRIAEEASLEN